MPAPTRTDRGGVIAKRLGIRREAILDLLSLLALQWIGLALYFGTLRHPPIWDDVAQVAGQPFLHSCSNLWTVLNPRYLFWVLPVQNTARPAWLASVILDTCLYGDAFGGCRLTNILWHSAGAVLVAGLAWEMTRERWSAWLAGLLFLAHPAHTEAVNIVAFRTDLMALVFMALGLLLYRRARRTSDRRSVRWLAASAGVFGLALLSKEMAVTLPLLMALGDWLLPSPSGPPPSPTSGPPSKNIRRRDAGNHLAVFGAFGLLILAYLFFHTPRSGYVFGGHRDVLSQWKEDVPWTAAKVAPEFDFMIDDASDPQDAMPWQTVYRDKATRVRTMARVFGSYLRLLLWPRFLQGDYSPVPAGSWRDPGVPLACAAWLAWLAAAWVLRRRSPAVAFGMFWVPIALLPVSGIVAIRNLEAERYLYIPSAGFCIALSAALSEGAAALGGALRFGAIRARGAMAVLGIALASVYGLRTEARNQDYRDNEAFFKATLRNDPDVARAHVNLGKVYDESGDWTRAEAEYRTALRLWPALFQGRILLARFLVDRGRLADAIEELRLAQQAAPQHVGVRYNLGLAHWMAGRRSLAERYFLSAAHLRPRDWRTNLALGSLRLQMGKARKAIAPLTVAARSARGRSSIMASYYLSYAYRAAGNDREADRVVRDIKARAGGAQEAPLP